MPQSSLTWKTAKPRLPPRKQKPISLHVFLRPSALIPILLTPCPRVLLTQHGQRTEPMTFTQSRIEKCWTVSPSCHPPSHQAVPFWQIACCEKLHPPSPSPLPTSLTYLFNLRPSRKTGKPQSFPCTSKEAMPAHQQITVRCHFYQQSQRSWMQSKAKDSPHFCWRTSSWPTTSLAFS